MAVPSPTVTHHKKKTMTRNDLKIFPTSFKIFDESFVCEYLSFDETTMSKINTTAMM